MTFPLPEFLGYGFECGNERKEELFCYNCEAFFTDWVSLSEDVRTAHECQECGERKAYVEYD